LCGVAQADDIAPVIAIQAEWDDLFDITVVPCLTAEKGLAIGAQLGRAGRRASAHGALRL
jgi:hypothetical protein